MDEGFRFITKELDRLHEYDLDNFNNEISKFIAQTNDKNECNPKMIQRFMQDLDEINQSNCKLSTYLGNNWLDLNEMYLKNDEGIYYIDDGFAFNKEKSFRGVYKLSYQFVDRGTLIRDHNLSDIQIKKLERKFKKKRAPRPLDIRKKDNCNIIAKKRNNMVAKYLNDKYFNGEKVLDEFDIPKPVGRRPKSLRIQRLRNENLDPNVGQ